MTRKGEKMINYKNLVMLNEFYFERWLETYGRPTFHMFDLVITIDNENMIVTVWKNRRPTEEIQEIVDILYSGYHIIYKKIY
jgi:hypothetical protein